MTGTTWETTAGVSLRASEANAASVNGIDLNQPDLGLGASGAPCLRFAGLRHPIGFACPVVRQKRTQADLPGRRTRATAQALSPMGRRNALATKACSTCPARKLDSWASGAARTNKNTISQIWPPRPISRRSLQRSRLIGLRAITSAAQGRAVTAVVIPPSTRGFSRR